MNDLKGKVAIVTGSSKGIGKVTAIALCEKGMRVVLNGRNLEKLNSTEAELKKMGYDVIGIQADITVETECETLLKETILKYGAVDVLVNNASITMNESIANLSPKEFANIFRSNSMGSILPTLNALPFIKESRGSVVFISSLGGLYGMPLASAYCSGKMSLTSFWQTLRIEMNDLGVHFGICYLSFTKNDEDKQMVRAKGELVPVPKRAALITQSQEKVANGIVRMIERRQAKKIFSKVGKVTALMLKFFPKFTLFVFKKSYKPVV
jgi:short-subunit dehydrogenase